MTIKYKIQRIEDGFETIIKLSSDPNHTGWSIPKSPENSNYQRFLQDVKEEGLTIVEGPDVITPDYKQQRLEEYPSLTDQQDMQYWDAVNGTTTWKDKINEIKTKYPKTNTGSTTVGDVPSWVQTEVDKLNS